MYCVGGPGFQIRRAKQQFASSSSVSDLAACQKRSTGTGTYNRPRTEDASTSPQPRRPTPDRPCAERRPSLTEELKAQLGADFKYTLVMTTLGEEWRGVGDKSKYEAMAAADKASKAA